MRYLSSWFGPRQLTRRGLAIRGSIVLPGLLAQKLRIEPPPGEELSWGGLVFLVIFLGLYGWAWVRRNERHEATSERSELH